MVKYNVDSDKNTIYDVAFSFAGEQRDYVEKLYNILHDEHNLNIFYDNDEDIEADLWGANLVDKFDEIYGKSSKYCIIFISKEYNQKVWTNVERKSALSKAINEKREYILPARFDDTEITGIQSTISYIDLSNITPNEFSKVILKKLGINTNEKFDNRISDIKLNVNHCVLISMNPIDKTTNKSSYITIKVENHGIYPVFFKYPLVKIKNSTDSFHIFNDDFFNKPINIGKLEAGDSHEIYVDPKKYNDFLDRWDSVVIIDKIGRTVKAPKEELSIAIQKWKEL